MVEHLGTYIRLELKEKNGFRVVPMNVETGELSDIYLVKPNYNCRLLVVTLNGVDSK